MNDHESLVNVKGFKFKKIDDKSLQVFLLLSAEVKYEHETRKSDKRLNMPVRSTTS